MDPNSLDYQVLMLREHEIVDGEDLWWRCGPGMLGLNHGDVMWLINCNDMFYWGTADAEEIKTLEDVQGIRLAYGDLERADMAEYGENKFHCVYASALWVCRKREMRPQKPWVDLHTVAAIRDLFLQWPAKPDQGWPL